MKPLPLFDRFFRLNAWMTLLIALGVIGAGWGPVFFQNGSGGEYGALFSILIFFAVDFCGTVALTVAAIAQLVGWLVRGAIGTMIGLIFQLLYGTVYTWVGVQVEFMTPAAIGAIPALVLAVVGLAVFFITPKGARHWQSKK